MRLCNLFVMLIEEFIERTKLARLLAGSCGDNYAAPTMQLKRSGTYEAIDSLTNS